MRTLWTGPAARPDDRHDVLKIMESAGLLIPALWQVFRRPFVLFLLSAAVLGDNERGPGNDPSLVRVDCHPVWCQGMGSYLEVGVCLFVWGAC